MKSSENNSSHFGKSHLLGIGLDGKDKHKRITQSERFSVVGGSEETHEAMTETLIKTMEEISRKGKDLDEIEPTQLSDIIQKHRPE